MNSTTPLTTADVARMAGCGPRTVSEAVRLGKLVAMKVGARRGKNPFAYLITEEEAARWIKERKEAKK